MQRDGYLWEEGPSSFQPNDSMLKAAVRRYMSCLEEVRESSLSQLTYTCPAQTLPWWLLVPEQSTCASRAGRGACLTVKCAKAHIRPSAVCASTQVDAGIGEDLVFGDPKAPRFVFWEGRLRPTPSGPDVLTFDLLSLWGKLRAGLGAAGLKAKMPGAARCRHSRVRVVWVRPASWPRCLVQGAVATAGLGLSGCGRPQGQDAWCGALSPQQG